MCMYLGVCESQKIMSDFKVLELWASHLMWVLGTGSGPLKEEQVLLTAEPSLQIHMALFCIHLHRSLYCNMNTKLKTLCFLFLHPNLSSCYLTMLVSFMSYAHPWFYVFTERICESKQRYFSFWDLLNFLPLIISCLSTVLHHELVPASSYYY